MLGPTNRIRFIDGTGISILVENNLLLRAIDITIACTGAILSHRLATDGYYVAYPGVFRINLATEVCSYIGDLAWTGYYPAGGVGDGNGHGYLSSENPNIGQGTPPCEEEDPAPGFHPCYTSLVPITNLSKLSIATNTLADMGDRFSQGRWGVVGVSNKGSKGYFVGGGCHYYSGHFSAYDGSHYRWYLDWPGPPVIEWPMITTNCDIYFGHSIGWIDSIIYVSDTLSVISGGIIDRYSAASVTRDGIKSYAMGGYHYSTTILTHRETIYNDALPPVSLGEYTMWDGEETSIIVSDDIETLLFATDTISAAASLGAARAGSAAIGDGLDSGYCVGGDAGSYLLDSIEKISLVLGVVSTLSATLSAPRGFMAGITNGTTCGYIIGGVDDGENDLNLIEKLDFATETISICTAVSPIADTHCAGFNNEGT